MIAQARQALADTLVGVGVPVHAYPPQALSAPAIVLVPGYPYYAAHTLAGDADISLNVQILASNQSSLDELIVAVATTLITAGMHPSPIAEPIPDPEVGIISARIPVTMTWKEV